ncbi:MAG TPA: ATP-binding protein [Gammaproteobacteria bacterium]
MPRHFAISVAATLVIAAATLATWKILEDDYRAQNARIVASESQAARSQLARNFELMLGALRSVHRYWSTYGHLPREQWATDVRLEPLHFEGIDLVFWSDPVHGVQYARTPGHPELDHAPTPEDLRVAAPLLEHAGRLRGEEIIGPFQDAAGNPTYRVYMVDARGVFVAVVDASRSFAAMLRDVSPGYSVEVRWDGMRLYRRGEPAHDLPGAPTTTGVVRPTSGTLWQVALTPTGELEDVMSVRGLTALLFSGFAIAGLVGLLVLENRRARERARAAEVAEHELALLNRNLEREIAERTKELADRSADLGTITDSVAHDLRNPLNTISVNTQLLAQQFGDVLGPDGLTALERTGTAVKRMTEILDRLLGLSIVSHATFRRERVDMTEMVRDIFDELAASEPPPPVELALAELPDAHADPKLVRTLALNLLSNALKYTRTRDRRHVEVGCEQGKRVPVYFVRDNGIGFDGDSAERLFRAFEREERDESNEDGIGLGLNIAVRVVRRHDGRIWAESRPGEGAAFYFTLEPEASHA